MGIADDVVKILQIKIKPRRDSYSDQFSRILLLKVLMLGAFFTGIDWYSDKINCIVPKDLIDKDFVSQSCWINGVYVYENIRFHNNEIGYYGLPRDIRFDGKYINGEMCQTSIPTSNGRSVDDPKCKPMKKTFFLQYQYMTFFLLAMAALYYAPYTYFKFVNTDMASLKAATKEGNADAVVNSFFNPKVNQPSRMWMRIFGNIFGKIIYILSNVVAFFLTDRVLHGGFTTYGKSWNSWTHLNNTMAYDYMGRRHFPKPGNELLPSFGLCEVHEMAQDIIHKVINKHRFVCEMSQHILYQYVLILIWWAMIFGIVVAIAGLFALFVDYIFVSISVNKQNGSDGMLHLSLRECEYLAYIHRKNMPLYGDVLKKLEDVGNKGLVNDIDMDALRGKVKDQTSL